MMHEDGSVNVRLEVECLSAKYPADISRQVLATFFLDQSHDLLSKTSQICWLVYYVIANINS